MAKPKKQHKKDAHVEEEFSSYKFKKKFLITIVFVAIIVILVVIIFLAFLKSNLKATNFTFSLPLEGYEKSDINVDSESIYFTSGCKRISMSPTFEQLVSIARALEKKEDVRPNSHDLLTRTLDEFKINILAATIERKDNEIYYARIFMQQGNKVLALDSRPSDAVAIALRENANVYVNHELLEQFGEKIC